MTFHNQGTIFTLRGSQCSNANNTFGAERKWSSFCKRYFQIDFLARNLLYRDLNFTLIHFLDNRSTPSRREVIIWTTGGLVYWRIHTSLGLNGLNLTSSCSVYFWLRCWRVSRTFDIAGPNLKGVCYRHIVLIMVYLGFFRERIHTEVNRPPGGHMP